MTDELIHYRHCALLPVLLKRQGLVILIKLSGKVNIMKNQKNKQVESFEDLGIGRRRNRVDESSAFSKYIGYSFKKGRSSKITLLSLPHYSTYDKEINNINKSNLAQPLQVRKIQ